MITGATLLDFYERYGLKEYFKKRIVKKVIPYIAWSLIGIIYQALILKSIDMQSLNLTYILKGIIRGNLIGIYWFFPHYSVYICLFPYLRLCLKKKRKRFVLI